MDLLRLKKSIQTCYPIDSKVLIRIKTQKKLLMRLNKKPDISPIQIFCVQHEILSCCSLFKLFMGQILICCENFEFNQTDETINGHVLCQNTSMSKMFSNDAFRCF